MMLQNTSSRLKRFITQRQNKSTQDLANETCNPRFSDYQLSANYSRKLSWLSDTPSTEKIPHRLTSNTTVPSHHDHQPITASSSASSLCSCDCKGDLLPVEQSLSRVQPPIQQDILCLPSTKISDDEKSWRIIFPEQLPRISSLSPDSTPCRQSPLSPTEGAKVAKLQETNDNDSLPTQSINYISDPFMDNLSANVEQLIRETDEAFKAVGSALAEAKAATGWYDTRSSPPVPHAFSISRGIMRQSRSPVPVSPLRTPISKIKAKSSVKTKARPKLNLAGGKKKLPLFGATSKPKYSHPQVPGSPTRWTLNDVTTNMVDVFSGRRFRALEADEMLTPLRVQKLKDQVAAKNEKRASDESGRPSISTVITDGDDDVTSPTEPFHLEDLIDKIEAKNRATSPPMIDTAETTKENIAKPEIPNTNFDIEYPFPPTPISSNMIFDDFSFPAPPIPPRNPRRLSSITKSHLPLLPTISEISPLNLSPSQFLQFPYAPSISTPSITDSASSPTTKQHEPQYTLFPSTQYSFLSPNFKHGSIRIENFAKARKEEGVQTEEGEHPDWVAFQMAISGNMDEYVGNERSDSEWELDEIEIDEIVAWWEGFGWSLGGLVGEEEYLRTVETAEVLIGMEDDLRQFEAVEDESQAEISPLTPQASEQDRGALPKELEDIRTMIEEDHQQELEPSEPAPAYQTKPSTPEPLQSLPVPDDRRPSVASSMPPSPMMDWGLGGSNDEEVVPMGFNLGHDLGDYLNWETNHVNMLMKDE